MEDIILIAVIALILGAAVWYVHRAKKTGVKCIGCPNGGTCGGNCSGCGGGDGSPCGGGCSK